MVDFHQHSGTADDGPRIPKEHIIGFETGPWELVHFEEGSDDDFTITGLDLTTDREYFVLLSTWSNAENNIRARINANSGLHAYTGQYVENRNSATQTTGTESSWASPPTQTDWGLHAGRNFASYNIKLTLSRVKTNNYHIIGRWETAGHGTDLSASKYYDIGSIHGCGQYGSNADQNLTSLEILGSVTMDYKIWIFKPKIT